MSRVVLKLNLPNQLTLGRLGLCALFVAALTVDDWDYGGTAALAIFIVASLTDWLDGWIARRYHMVTDLGKLLDPLADKILVSAAFVGLMDFGYAPMWMVVVIISREFLITGLRIIAVNRGFVMAAERAGKHKTISQMVVILVSLVLISASELQITGLPLDQAKEFVQVPLLWVTVLITVLSGAIYFYKNRSLFTSELTEDQASEGSKAVLAEIVPQDSTPNPIKSESASPLSPPTQPGASTFPAFKEWQIIVEALGTGRQSIILRKGGIAEGKSGFAVRHRAFWLFPTRFHQQAEKVISSTDSMAFIAEAEHSPVRLDYYAVVTQVAYVQDWEMACKLAPFHLWKEEVVRERFEWGKEKGLHCILARIYRLRHPVILDWNKDFEGCKSWVDLDVDWATRISEPVLSDEDYAALRERIVKTVNFQSKTS